MLFLIDHCHPQWCILLVWRWRFWWEACKIFGEACKISGETWKIFGETSNAEDWRCVPVPQHSQGDHHSDYMADDDFTMITRVMLMIPSRATTTWFWRRVSPTRTSMATATLTSSISSLRWTALPSHQLDGRKKYKTSHHLLSDETVWFLWTMKMFLLQPFNGFWFVWFWNIFSRSTDTTTGCQGTTSWYISPYHKYCCNMMRTTSTSTSTSTTSMQRNQR